MNDQSTDPIQSAIYAAWSEVLARNGFNPDQPLAQTGADSLRIMRFVLQTEATLDRTIPYDLLAPDITAKHLAALLKQAIAPISPNAFLLGGIAGDEALLGDLRRGLADEFTFDLLATPGSEQPPALLSDLQATATVIAAEIERRQPQGAVRLLGYSYGGLLAFEAAGLLLAGGRTVALLCLLDAAPVRGPIRRLTTMLSQPRSLWGKLRYHAPRWVNAGRTGTLPKLAMEIAYSLGAFRLSARFARTAPATDTDGRAWLADRLDLWSLRVRAAEGWRPARLDYPGTAILLVSKDGRGWGAPRFWRKLLPHVTVIDIPGTHTQLARPETLQMIRAALSPFGDGQSERVG